MKGLTLWSRMLYRCADALSYGDDALILAAYYGHLNMVKYLLTLRVKIPWEELLTYAVRGGRLEVVNYLLSYAEGIT